MLRRYHSQRIERDGTRASRPDSSTKRIVFGASGVPTRLRLNSRFVDLKNTRVDREICIYHRRRKSVDVNVTGSAENDSKERMRRVVVFTYIIPK